MIWKLMVYVCMHICMYLCRLRKKRNTDIAVEPMLVNIVMSSCAILMITPVDMAEHTPALIFALIMLLSIGHTHTNSNSVTSLTAVCNYSVIKDLISKTMSDFRRNHQDKINSPAFRGLFTPEQWQELQGLSSTATYFA